MSKAPHFCCLLASLVVLMPVASVADPAKCHALMTLDSHDRLAIDGKVAKSDAEIRQRIEGFQKRHCIVTVVGGPDTDFKKVGRLIMRLQQAGVVKIGFLTEPRNEP